MQDVIKQQIKDYLKDNGILNNDLARMMGVSPQVLHQKLNRNKLQMDDLIAISVILKHNFFSEISRRVGEDINKA